MTEEERTDIYFRGASQMDFYYKKLTSLWRLGGGDGGGGGWSRDVSKRKHG